MVPLFLLAGSAILSVGQEAPYDDPPASQPVREVEAHSHRDDRVHRPLTKHECSGGEIGSSRLWLKVISMGDGVVKLGQELAVTVEVHNGSESPVEIPIAPSLREVEPSDPHLSYSWRALGISVNGSSGERPWQYMVDGAVLYGSEETGTMLKLKPFEWIVVRFVTKFTAARYAVGKGDKIIETSIPAGARLNITVRPRLSESFRESHYDARSGEETVTCGGVAQGTGKWMHILLTN
jgi:hypothetical protein